MGFMHNKFRKHKTTEQSSPLPVKREVLLPTVAKSLLIGSHVIVEFPLHCFGSLRYKLVWCYINTLKLKCSASHFQAVFCRLLRTLVKSCRRWRWDFLERKKLINLWSLFWRLFFICWQWCGCFVWVATAFRRILEQVQSCGDVWFPP